MINPESVTLHEKLKHLDRRENWALIRQIDSRKCHLAELIVDIGGSPGVQGKALAEINELSQRIETLRVVVGAVFDEFSSFQCAFDGLTDMLWHMGEKEINAQRLLHLLIPLNRKFREASNEFDVMVGG